MSQAPRPATLWLMTDGKAGDRAQVLGVAAHLPGTAIERVIAPRAPWAWLAPRGPIDPKDAPDRPGSPLAGPFPDMAIGTGRRVVPYLRRLKWASGGATFTAFLKDPRVGAHIADALWVPAHDRLRGANVLATLTGPHRFSAEFLAAERANPPLWLERLPSPRIAILLGGSTRSYRYDAAAIAEFTSKLRALAETSGSFFLTASRRTEEGLLSAARAAIAHHPHLVWDGTQPNPYPQFLAHADGFVITADSANMLGEAAATGRAIQYFAPSEQKGLPKMRRYLQGLEHAGVARPLGAPGPDTAPAMDATPEIAAFLMHAYARHAVELTPHGLG